MFRSSSPAITNRRPSLPCWMPCERKPSLWLEWKWSLRMADQPMAPCRYHRMAGTAPRFTRQPCGEPPRHHSRSTQYCPSCFTGRDHRPPGCPLQTPSRIYRTLGKCSEERNSSECGRRLGYSPRYRELDCPIYCCSCPDPIGVGDARYRYSEKAGFAENVPLWRFLQILD